MIWDKAIYRPIKSNFNSKDDVRSKGLKKPDGLIIHWTGTTESVAQVWAYFNMSVTERRKVNPRAPASSAHFVVDRDGTAIQMIDTEAMAFSVDGFKYDGTRVSVEVISTPKNPLFTQEQIDTCGDLLGWLNIQFGTPIKLAKNKTDSGLSYHRMYAGTECPGQKNIENLGKIIDAANKAVQINPPEIYKFP
ncbi:MAG TPA: peptidoglycan recognition family protein [Pyrinomonadaceae bacterium]|nr:peptidoglycan recognition family protein [Pyrinomonadaceae bacterium]